VKGTQVLVATSQPCVLSQLAFVVHCTQAPPAPHTGVAVRCAQSALVAHVAHVFVVVSQRAMAAVVHCVLSRQATQTRLVVSQCWPVGVQSPSATHPTHE
jgi:hypothetical protein